MTIFLILAILKVTTHKYLTSLIWAVA